MIRIKYFFAFLCLSLFISCSDNSSNPEESLEGINVETNYLLTYNVYQEDFLSNELGEFISQEDPIYGYEKEFEGKKSFSFKLIELENKKYLFSQISTDNQGIYLYIPELDINKLIFGGKLDSNLSRFTPGWVKIYDYSNDSWTANEFKIDKGLNGDTLNLVFKINGTKDGSKSVEYLNKTQKAFVSKLVIDMEADIVSKFQKANYTIKTNLRFQFLNNIGIYSISLQENQLFPINKDLIYILQSKYGV